MHKPFIIDLVAHPGLQFRLDAFSVPAAARADFEAAMQRNLDVLKQQPGFVDHLVLEKASGPSQLDLVTLVVWASAEAAQQASAAMRAYHQRIGFELPAMAARLGITAQLGFYTVPARPGTAP